MDFLKKQTNKFNVRGHTSNYIILNHNDWYVLSVTKISGKPTLKF